HASASERGNRSEREALTNKVGGRLDFFGSEQGDDFGQRREIVLSSEEGVAPAQKREVDHGCGPDVDRRSLIAVLHVNLGGPEARSAGARGNVGGPGEAHVADLAEERVP